MRKAQAAMEFLMTYGWAILVVLAAIGALAYFGVLNTSQLLPEKCTFDVAGFACEELKVDSTDDEVRFLVRWTGGRDLQNVAITLSDSDCAPATSTLTPNVTGTAGELENRDEYRVVFDCSTNLTGAVDGDVDIRYQFQGGSENYTAPGQFQGRAQE